MVSNPAFPNLERMIQDRGIKVTAICRKIGISQKTFYDKRIGKSQFTWNEVCGIQEFFFPDVEKNVLFSNKA